MSAVTPPILADLNKAHVVDVMASMIHDHKNQLFQLITSLDVGAAVDVRASLHTLARRLELTLTAYRVMRHDPAFEVVPITDVELGPLVDEAFVCVGLEGGRTDVAWEVSLDYSDNWLLSRELVKDVLVNVLQNALRYARRTIWVTSHLAPDGWLELGVRDDGPGFAPDLVGVDPRHPHGLGLFIGSRIMAMHRTPEGSGRMTLSNDNGAVVTLRFPPVVF